MKKSILGIALVVVVLALLLGEKNYLSQKEDEGLYYASIIEEVTYPQEISEEMVLPAQFPEEGMTIVIEDTQVPLAATVPEENKQEESVTVKAQTSKVPVGVSKTEMKTESRYSDLGGGVYGYYDEKAAEELIAQVNVMRLSGQSTSALNAELNDVAKKRALACVNDFSHNGMETAAECMAVGQKDAAAVVTAWYASDVHRGYISDAIYSQAGAACICYEKSDGQMQTVWVLVLN